MNVLLKIQDVGIWIGIALVCLGSGLWLAFSLGIAVGFDFSKIPFGENLYLVIGGLGVFLAAISLISLAKSK